MRSSPGWQGEGVCHYCGCRQIPLIRDYIAEHDQVLDLGGRAVRALGHGEVDEATALVVRMREELRTHWQGEENGIFAVMADQDEMYADYVAPLIREHRELEEFLATIDLGSEEHRSRLTHEMEDLAEHITREEDGLFPATLVSLAGPEWDVAMAAWHEAHPGESLIED